MWRLCQAAERSRLPVHLHGGTGGTLEPLRPSMRLAFPQRRIAGALPPPFRAPSPQQEAVQTAAIHASGARIAFIGLGCPKQEVGMARMRGRIRALTPGAGGAFDHHAGTLRRAPPWMRKGGLEWASRLAMAPRRLWRRYVWTNGVFLLHVVRRLAADGFSCAPRQGAGSQGPGCWWRGPAASACPWCACCCATVMRRWSSTSAPAGIATW